MATKIIKAPFNFVPISDKVVFPDWAAQISHDIPFSDGLSGEIELRIEAKSPIFVRNGHAQDDKDNNIQRYDSFSNADGKFFIPATSLKGAIRNVLEIMSFSKLTLNKRAQFAQKRDLNSDNYEIKTAQNQLHCGWLKCENNNYKITDCDKPLRISHVELDKIIAEPVFQNNFSDRNKIGLNSSVKVDSEEYDPKTARYKYHLLERHIDLLSNFHFSEKEGKAEKEVYYDPEGSIIGKIVFTGQPNLWNNNRKQNKGKFKEFVFRSDREKIEHSLTEDEFRHFEFIYKDSDDWKWAKTKLSNGGIPVFFRLEKNRIKDFGMAFMYKVPYDNTPYNLLPEEHKEASSADKKDFADCIFGYTSNEGSLRGRVQFTPAWATENIELDKERILCLGSPKASYYPIYIKQDGKDGKVNKYNEYNQNKNEKPSLAGWKRYPTRATVWGAKNDYNEKLDTKMTPLKPGAVFKAKLRYHNLRPVELGAVLSALSFHNTPNQFHQIGQAKAYGYGKLQVSFDLSEEQIQCMTQYEFYLDKQLASSWHNTEEVCELFAMSGDNKLDDRFEYMKLEIGRDKDQFSMAKSEREYLERFTKIIYKSAGGPVSLLKGFREEIERLDAAIKEVFAKNNFEEAASLCQKLKNKDLLMATEWEKIISDKRRSLRYEEASLQIHRLLDQDNIEEAVSSFKQLNIDFENYMELDRKTIQAKIETKRKKSKRLGQSYPDFISKYNNNFNTLTEQTKKVYIKKNGALNASDQEALKAKLVLIYTNMKPRDQKQYNNFMKWKALFDIVGEEKAGQWFKDITGKDA